MRVTGGSAKGYVLKVPSGGRVRPVTDMVKQALFSILEGMAQDWSYVLDLYAGSGALGIEALSRGAGWTDFVEKEPRHCAVIKENLKKTGFNETSHVYCASVSKALGFLDRAYDIILVDAPYADPKQDSLLSLLNSSGAVGAKSLVAISHSSRRPLADGFEDLYRVREERYGDTAVSIFRKGGTK